LSNSWTQSARRISTSFLHRHRGGCSKC